MKPVVIFIGRKELLGYTSLSLSRSKEDMTGTLDVTVFMGYMPSEPPMAEASHGKEILVYVGGHLAFTGTIDSRTDSSEYNRDEKGRFTGGKKTSAGTEATVNVGPNDYSVNFNCRGKTRTLIDSSHQHPTGTMLRTDTKTAFETLMGPFGIELDWQAETQALDKVRLRDGGWVVDELQRIATQASLYLTETRDGLLRVADASQAPTIGEEIILGANILDFSTTIDQQPQKSDIVVKGQRIEVDQWGVDAVLPTLTQVATNVVDVLVPTTVQSFGNALPETLEKRAQFEASKRNAAAMKITVEVFNVTQRDGSPWDIGVMHYVEIPPAGVFGAMEVTKLTYNVQPDKKLSTSLTLSPATNTSLSGSTSGGQGGFLAEVPEVSNLTSLAFTRKSAAGQSGPNFWVSPTLDLLTPVINAVTSVLTAISPKALNVNTDLLGGVSLQAGRPPMDLPIGYTSEER